jgi:hypothetical protein
MTRVLACALATVLVALGVGTVARAAADQPATVDVDRTAVSTTLGRSFVFRSTVANHGTAPARGLVAHLNVLSLRDGVYVDPEDWSSNRTRYLAPLAPGGTTTLNWKLQAVNTGSFGVYVAVLPSSGAAIAPPTSRMVHVIVADRSTIDSGGILPLALGVPALLSAVAVGVRLRRHR